MKREAERVVEAMGRARATATGEESSTEPPAIQIKMPNSEFAIPDRMHTRRQDKTRGGVGQLLQDLINGLDKNDRQSGGAFRGLNEELNTHSRRAEDLGGEQLGDTATALDRLRQQANSFSEQVEAAGDARNAKQSAQSTENNIGQSGDANDALPRPNFGDDRLGSKFAHATETLDRSLSNREPAAGSDALAQRMERLAQQLDAAPETKNGAATLKRIESQINALTSRFVEAQQTYAKVNAIEAHLIDLMRWAENSGTANQNAQDDGRLAAIEQALKDLSDSSREMDSRTLSALKAMNQVLHLLASQTGARAAATAQVTSDKLPKAGAPPSRVQAEEGCHKQDAHAGIEQPQSAEKAPRLRSDVSANPLNARGGTIPDSLPPSGKPGTAAPTQSAQRTPRTEPKPQRQINARHGTNTDFIASPPRAATTAATRKPSSAGSQRSARSEPNFPIADAGESSPNKAQGDRRRPILIAAAVILLIVSAGLLYSRLKSAPEAQPAVDAPQFTASTAPRSASGRSNNKTTNQTPATGNAKTIAWPKSKHTPPPDQELHPDRTGGVPAPITQPNIMPRLQPASGKPQPSDVTMEIREPEPRTVATLSGNASGGVVPSMALPSGIGPTSLRVAATRGSPAAQVEIGLRYERGTGVSKDPKKAAEWYGRAAAQGHAPAQYRLAIMHERGEGVKKDSGVARTWYRRAAELGNVHAMHNLAVLYTQREANRPDYTSAKKWFFQAARHGLADSQFNLGIHFESGLGTHKNKAEAYKWFSLAARQGDNEARRRREAIRPQLSAETLKAADTAIANWRKVPAIEEANRAGQPSGSWSSSNLGQSTGSVKPALIARTQKLLNKLGYDAGTADGRLGPQTKSAIRKFESGSGFEGTGAVTPALLRRLEALTS